jgi:hypothetical protein
MTTLVKARWSRRACLAAAAALLSSAPAGAGEVSLTLDGGWHVLTNSANSAKAVFDGTAGGPTVGFAGQFGIGESFFVRAGARFFQRDGERVFVAGPGQPVFRLGHPLKLRLIPAYGLVGFRFLQGASLRPYVGVGGGVTVYHEESDVAGEIFESTATKPAGYGVAGLDYGRGVIRIGGEVMYSMVPNTIGFGGVSQVYGEDDIGGLSALVRLSFVH